VLFSRSYLKFEEGFKQRKRMENYSLQPTYSLACGWL